MHTKHAHSHPQSHPYPYLSVEFVRGGRQVGLELGESPELEKKGEVQVLRPLRKGSHDLLPDPGGGGPRASSILLVSVQHGGMYSIMRVSIDICVSLRRSDVCVHASVRDSVWLCMCEPCLWICQRICLRLYLHFTYLQNMCAVMEVCSPDISLKNTLSSEHMSSKGLSKQFSCRCTHVYVCICVCISRVCIVRVRVSVYLCPLYAEKWGRTHRIIIHPLRKHT